MTKPNRIQSVACRSEHARPTRPAPAYAACRAAAMRAASDAETRSTLPVDPDSQAQLMRIRDALVAPRLPTLSAVAPTEPSALTRCRSCWEV